MENRKTLLKVMVKELPEDAKDTHLSDHYVAITGGSYESTMRPGGAEHGIYKYNPMTGIYSLSNGATLRINTRDYTYTDEQKKVRMVEFVAARTVVAELHGAAPVVIPGGYTMDIVFTLVMFSDATCVLTQSISKTVFGGSWSKDEASNYQIHLDHIHVGDCTTNAGTISTTIQGNLGGINFSAVMSGQEV